MTLTGLREGVGDKEGKSMRRRTLICGIKQEQVLVNDTEETGEEVGSKERKRYALAKLAGSRC